MKIEIYSSWSLRSTYKEKNGQYNVPTTNGSLGKWILYQRALCRRKKLEEDRYEKLVGIGFA
jgi:hypothetical protein